MSWETPPPSLSSVVVDYLASLKSLHDVCMAVELVPDWPDYIETTSGIDIGVIIVKPC